MWFLEAGGGREQGGAPLKPVIRMATPEDEAVEAKNKEKEKAAFKICQEKKSRSITWR